MTLDALLGLGFWPWIILGLVLAAAETVAPGAFLIWLGLAAIVTGIIDAVYPLSLTWSLIVFTALIFVSCFFGRKLYGGLERTKDAPFLNRRIEGLIGREFVLDQAIEKGTGRIRVDDSVWRVAGPDTPVGARVRVTGTTHATLLTVEPV